MRIVGLKSRKPHHATWSLLLGVKIRIIIVIVQQKSPNFNTVSHNLTTILTLTVLYGFQGDSPDPPHVYIWVCVIYDISI